MRKYSICKGGVARGFASTNRPRRAWPANGSSCLRPGSARVDLRLCMANFIAQPMAAARVLIGLAPRDRCLAGACQPGELANFRRRGQALMRTGNNFGPKVMAASTRPPNRQPGYARSFTMGPASGHALRSGSGCATRPLRACPFADPPREPFLEVLQPNSLPP